MALTKEESRGLNKLMERGIPVYYSKKAEVFSVTGFGNTMFGIQDRDRQNSSLSFSDVSIKNFALGAGPVLEKLMKAEKTAKELSRMIEEHCS